MLSNGSACVAHIANISKSKSIQLAIVISFSSKNNNLHNKYKFQLNQNLYTTVTQHLRAYHWQLNPIQVSQIISQSFKYTYLSTSYIFANCYKYINKSICKYVYHQLTFKNHFHVDTDRYWRYENIFTIKQYANIGNTIILSFIKLYVPTFVLSTSYNIYIYVCMYVTDFVLIKRQSCFHYD